MTRMVHYVPPTEFLSSLSDDFLSRHVIKWISRPFFFFFFLSIVEDRSMILILILILTGRKWKIVQLTNLLRENRKT